MPEKASPSSPSRRAYERGKRGETEAVEWFESRGMKVLARNVRCPRGEIDLVVQDSDTLAFVEVKSWSSWGASELENAIGPTKQKKITETAKFFLSQHREYSCMAYRFDVLMIGSSGILHLAHAFTERV